MALQATVEAARFRFTCRRCQAWWCREYQVRRWQDLDGTQFEFYEQYGIPMPAPTSGIACPACGGPRVTADTRVGVVPPSAPPPPARARPVHRRQRLPLVRWFP
ncbi:hypothetical protein [Frankia sp. AvcI1]|uniref:hypothetical protein n=1 Tax=Frankia sp. AvcI1 TaxID=573496 RepID=UPI002119465A|nr:hypothetical protein [Frankia sp. AvcI1]